MRINLPLELTDTERRTVRAALGRGGVATRKEIRVFAEHAIRSAIDAAPAPKTRRKVPVEQTQKSDRLFDLMALPDETRCSGCTRPKSEHGRMGLTCPPRSGRPYGKRFSR